MGWAFSSANLSVEREFDAGGRIELDDRPFSGASTGAWQA